METIHCPKCGTGRIKRDVLYATAVFDEYPPKLETWRKYVCDGCSYDAHTLINEAIHPVFLQGESVRRQGLPISSDPYMKGSASSTIFRKGWKEAR